MGYVESAEGIKDAERVENTGGIAASKAFRGAAAVEPPTAAKAVATADPAPIAEGTPQRKETQSGSSCKVSAKLWAAAGFVCFGLGAVGVVLPILPTTPFMLLAAFCFARSSKRLNDWFHATKLYQTVLTDYVADRRMTRTAKLKIIVPVTIILGISFALMSGVLIGRVVVGIVWVAHIIYFGFVVKTIPESTSDAPVAHEADAIEIA